MAVMSIQAFDVASLVVVLLAVVVAGWITVFVTLRRWMRTELQEMSVTLYEHIQVAQEQLQQVSRALQSAAAPSPVATETIAAQPEAAGEAMESPAETIAASVEVPEEELAAIAAAVAGFAGAEVTVKSIKPAPGMGDGGWAQQGRVHVHTSHNLSGRRVA